MPWWKRQVVDGKAKMILLQTKNDTLYWQLQDPKAGNSIGTSMMSQLVQALRELKARLRSDKAPRVLVVSASPTNGLWIAGGNLRELALLTAIEVRRYAQTMARLCVELTRLPIPVLVAVDGKAIGGGVELALAGDLILATKASSFHFKQLDVGLSLGYGSTQRLVQSVGLSRARHWVLGRSLISADQALDAGLVSEVVADSTALSERVAALAQELEAIDPFLLATQKKMLYLGHERTVKLDLASEQKGFLAVWGNPQHRKFLADFHSRSE